MANGDSMLRVKVPCADEGEFYARLADRIAQNGLRVPADHPPEVGARARVALEFRNGAVLSGEGLVEEHVEVESRPGVKVRILRLDPSDVAPGPSRPAAAAPPTLPAPARGPRASDVELAEVLFGEGAAAEGRTGAIAFTVSHEIAAIVDRRTARFQRAAIVVAALAVVVAVAGFAIARRFGDPMPAEAVVAAHVQAADRLLAEGQLSGKDGALDHLLAAKRLRPDDAATSRRLARLADMLERLAASALERGDAAVASIHLASARRAAPDRPSLRAKQQELERRVPKPAAAVAPGAAAGSAR